MPDYIILRLFLFSGLVLHKIVWEVLKRRDNVKPSSAKKQGYDLNSVLKFVKVLVLSFLVMQTLLLDIFPFSNDSFGIRMIGVIIYAVGLAVAISGRFQLGKNWANLEDYQVLPDQKLVKEGLYAYIRHPIYSGDILLILGLELALNSWLVLGIIPLVLFVIRQSRAEEAKLSRSFASYRDYQSRTKMFIPYIL